MPNCTVDLDELLISTAFLTLSSIRDLGQELYEKHYSGAVGHHTHDGQQVIFFSDRFDHAFSRSADFVAARGKKNEIDVQRVERIMWIAELLKGKVPESECITIPNSRSNRPDHRLYVINSECYVTWLGPLNSGCWKFSSAYKPLAYQIKQYRRSGKTIWRYGE